MASKPRRRQLIVNRFQHRLIVGNFLYLMAMLLVVGAMTVLPVVSALDDRDLPPQERDRAADDLLAQARTLLPVVPLIVVLCLGHSILVSHRFAGPLVRFTQVLGELGRGNLDQRVRLRRNDYLVSEAESINQAITALSLKVQHLRGAYEEVRAALPRLESAVASHEGSQAAVLAGELGTHLDALGERLGAFDLPGERPAEAPSAGPTPTQLSAVPR